MRRLGMLRPPTNAPMPSDLARCATGSVRLPSTLVSPTSRSALLPGELRRYATGTAWVPSDDGRSAMMYAPRPRAIRPCSRAERAGSNV
jgi:hypothetical protein